MNINCFSRKYSAPNLEINVTRNEKNSLSSHWSLFAGKKNSDFDFSFLNILRKCMEWVGDSYYDLWGPRNTVKNGNISLSPENRLKLRSNAITSLNVYNHIVQFIFFKRWCKVCKDRKIKIPIHNSCVVRSIHLERGEAAGTWIGGRILKGATTVFTNIDFFYFIFIFALILLQELQHQEVLCRYFYKIDQNITSVCWLEGGAYIVFHKMW